MVAEPPAEGANFPPFTESKLFSMYKDLFAPTPTQSSQLSCTFSTVTDLIWALDSVTSILSLFELFTLPTLPPLIFKVPLLTIFKALPFFTVTVPSSATSISFKTSPPSTVICLIPSAFT